MHSWSCCDGWILPEHMCLPDMVDNALKPWLLLKQNCKPAQLLVHLVKNTTGWEYLVFWAGLTCSDPVLPLPHLIFDIFFLCSWEQCKCKWPNILEFPDTEERNRRIQGSYGRRAGGNGKARVYFNRFSTPTKDWEGEKEIIAFALNSWVKSHCLAPTFLS